MIVLDIAGLHIGVRNRFSHIAEQSREYITDAPADFTVEVTAEDLQSEREMARASFSDGYLEFIAAYRKIAERLSEFDAFVFHGAVLKAADKAYAFTARSGVGKTTHTRLWVEEFSDVSYLNGDKPIIRFIDGVAYACGTPWRGKENLGICARAPLSGIAFLARGEENSAQPIEKGEAVERLLTQVYLPKSPSAILRTMELCDRLLSEVALIELRCNMDPSAAHVCRKAFLDADRLNTKEKPQEEQVQ